MHTMYKCKFHCTVSKRTLYEHENFMNIVETITKNMINHVSCLKNKPLKILSDFLEKF